MTNAYLVLELCVQHAIFDELRVSATRHILPSLES